MRQTARRWLFLGLTAGLPLVLALGGCEAVLGLGDLKDRVADGGALDSTVGPHADGAARADGPTATDGSESGPESVDAPVDVGCPEGAGCNLACPDGGTTTLSGTVYDPAGKNPISNVAVYVVPSTPLIPLPKGVPTGANACSCGALFPNPAITSTYTAADGTFTLTNVPAGNHIPLVIQVGKWRRLTFVDVTACTDNPQLDKSLALPSSVASGDTDDNIPDIAVSTGAADTLECLLSRIGLPASEYIAGAGTGGHVHIFSGGSPTHGGGGGGVTGEQETPTLAGSPPSPTTLWASQSQLMPYDLVLLSCEGGETYDANPPALEAYLNAGGRVFASHYHYSWFTGPIESTQAYAAPADWGPNLATWSADTAAFASTAIGGIINATFPQGQRLDAWLATTGALSDAGASSPLDAGDEAATSPGIPNGELPIYEARYNAKVSAANTASQAWITSDPASAVPGSTMYFSFDTPVGAPGGAYCGRAVYSDLHTGGAPQTIDTPPPPGGCAQVDLSPQEMALEFMLFDLSSCLTPWTP